MLPPLFLPDLRVGPSPRSFGPSPFEERSTLRRGAPQRLRIDPVPPHEPRVTLAALGPLPEPKARRGWLPRLRLARGPATA